MTPDAINNLNGAGAVQKQPVNQEALRRAAAQFEAILLMQLTSALNGSGDDDSLFGGDGGSNLAKQMFSEQLATTMADGGGIGLHEIIIRQLGSDAPKGVDLKRSLSAAVSTIKEAGNSDSAPPIDSSVRARVVPGAPVNEYRPENLIARVERFATAATEKTDLQMPVPGRISSAFGNRFHPVDRTVKFHAGIDIAAPRGTAVGAAGEGVVIFAGWQNGYGNLVVIRHPDGKETRYGHADRIFVRADDEVGPGQPIAAVGSTGKSTGPHLHFELRENGKPVDPRKYLSNVLPQSTDR